MVERGNVTTDRIHSSGKAFLNGAWEMASVALRAQAEFTGLAVMISFTLT